MHLYDITPPVQLDAFHMQIKTTCT